LHTIRHITIIGMSACAVASEPEKVIATGSDEFEAKPIEFESPVASIRRVVANPKYSPTVLVRMARRPAGAP
jgi:DNA-binding NarL/FixJ family response regulator